jgi:Caspase domain
MIPRNGKPGEWQNPAWSPGTPGVFALIIGVSHYAHLQDDNNSMHMGSLHVSAITAYRFFEWLSGVYRLEGVPVASCRLLLAPTREELACEPRLAEHSCIPTFEHCSDAILNWYSEMESLTLSDAERSRSVFFFSGHGLEVTEEMQVLLPHDYLRPPVKQYNRAIGTNNLRRGLKALKVNRHFLFMDACRNDHDNLKQQDPLEGSPILNQVLGLSRNSRCLVPLFFSSAAGKESFQPSDPQQGISMFGSALLEGLRGTGLKPNCDDQRCVINLDPLLGYCKQRIPLIAQQRFNQTIEQEVRLSGDYVQDPITEVPTPPRPPTQLNVRPTPPPPDRLPVHPDVPSDWRPDDFHEAHDVFDSERVTEPFLNARVFSYASGEWLAQEDDFRIYAVKHSTDRQIYEVDLGLARNYLADTIYWLKIADPLRTFGVIMPTAHQKIRYQLQLELSYDHSHGEPSHFTRVALSLSEQSDAPYGMLAKAWNAYRNASLSSATRIILSPQSAKDMERVLHDKVDSPLGSAIAGLLLVRGNEWPRLHHWLRNVANLFPWFADGSVLWAEQLLQQYPSNLESRREALVYLLQLDERELPLLAEVLAVAYSRLQEFADESEISVSVEERRKVRRLIQRYGSAIVYARSGGLFTVWAGAHDVIVPSMILRNYAMTKINEPTFAVDQMLEAVEESPNIDQIDDMEN